MKLCRGVSGTTRSRPVRGVCAVALLGLATWSGPALAQHEHRVEDAREAYDKGTEAHGRGDLASAARYFARADELAPNDVALQAALEAAIDADEAVLSMRLADRATARPTPEGVRAAVTAAHARFGARTGRLIVTCEGPIRCQATVNGQALVADVPEWLLAGQHALVVSYDGRKQSRTAVVVGGEVTRMIVAPPAPEQPKPVASAEPAAPVPAVVAQPAAATPSEAPQSPFASTWFWIGAGLTASLAAVTTWSALDVSDRHDTFVTKGCDRAGAAGCDDEASDGRSAQLRTNLLLGVTALVATGTLAIAVVPMWRSDTASSPRVEGSSRILPSYVGVHGRF